MIQAYFFDLDGTLVDTEILWVEAVESLAREHGYELSYDQALEMVYGVSWPEVFERFKKVHPLCLGISMKWALCLRPIS